MPYLNLFMPMGGPVPLLPPLRPPLGSTEFWKDSLMSCRTGPTSGASGRARDGDMLMLLKEEETERTR